ncbi:MAG: YHS domain-containing protein [Proteobacteria bacterium]|nr:YHS domain-containing protein [Pseudomonadota bacterium]
MAKDPVCHMEVDEKRAPAKSQYMGKIYYFCALACKKAFDKDPSKYTGGEGEGMAGHRGHKM